MKFHGSLDVERRLILSMVLTSLILVAELVGGILSNSLALLSDAAHVFMDVFALGTSFFALKISARPSDDLHTFGYHRVEVFAALINGLSLLAISIGIFIEAVKRLQAPLQVHSTEMLIIAIIGLVVNLIVAFVLGNHDQQNEQPRRKDLNVQSAFVHVLGDAISSIGVIIAAILITITHAQWLDPLVSFLIGGILIFSAYRILRSSLHILIEGVPEGLSVQEIKKEMTVLPAVEAVHDLHVWNICSGHISLSAHVVLDCNVETENNQVLQQINAMLNAKYAINHTTIQMETDPTSCGSGSGCN
jgi:cobalt-zinc-cadmium efflux system protein